MKMKELSAKTGIPDRTIRYYISDGMFVPEEYTENYQGRRTFDFTDNDVEQLKKISVYRKLGLSIDNIKLIFKDEINLQSAVEQSITQLEKEVEKLNGSIELCKEVLNNNETNKSLNADYYLNNINKKELQGKKFVDSIKDYARFEEDIFFLSMKNGYFGKVLKRIKEKHGYIWLSTAFIIISIISGFVGKYIWQYGFLIGFFRPLILFGIISVLILPVYLSCDKYPKFTEYWIKGILVILALFVLALLIFVASIFVNIFNQVEIDFV